MKQLGLDEVLKISNNERMHKLFSDFEGIEEFYTYISHMREDDFTQEVSWDKTYHGRLFDIVKRKVKEKDSAVLKVEDTTIGNLLDKLNLDNLGNSKNIDDEDDDGR